MRLRRSPMRALGSRASHRVSLQGSGPSTASRSEASGKPAYANQERPRRRPDTLRRQHLKQRPGVAATAKHFPGLGAAATNQDTDSRPVTLNVPRHQLRTVDERPYRSAIPAGVKLVMVSWARYPALDKRRPAGLSRTVVQGE